VKIALYKHSTTIKHGGVESIVWDTAQRLAARGHAVMLFGGRGDVSRPLPDVAVRRYPYIARDTWGRAKPLRRSLNLLKLLERLSMAARALPDLLAGGFDVVQVVKPYDFPIAALARRRGSRFVYNSHGTDFFPGDRLFRRQIDAAFACSRYNARMVEARYHIPIGVAYNGYDDALFRPIPVDYGLRQRYAPDGAPLILYAGRLVTFKGLDYLLDAMAILNRQEARGERRERDRPLASGLLPLASGPHLLLVGDGPHRPSLERRVVDLGLGDQVHFAGAQPHTEMPRFHSAADLFVVPSTDHETFCIAACEAQACERPVVGTTVGGIPEVVRDGATGYLVPPADSAALARMLAHVAAHPEEARQRGAQGRELVLAEFNLQANVAQLSQVLQRTNRALGSPAPQVAPAGVASSL
jgi:glycosyltransferase involved in cell wall biosynthesis